MQLTVPKNGLKKGIFQELAVAEKWLKYVPGFIRIQHAIHEWNMVKAKMPEEEVTTHNSIKNLSVLPIYSFGEKCVHLDTAALVGFHNEADPAHIIRIPKNVERGEPMTEDFKEMVWSKCFRLENLKMGASSFGYFVHLNSACISFTMHKRANYTRRIVPRSTKEYPESNAHVLEEIHTKLKDNNKAGFDAILGADLGSKNAMGIVELDTKHRSETNFLLTNKMWQR